MAGNRLLADSAITALAPAIWGSTYLVTTELLPPDRPLLAAVVRALPAGLVLVLFGRVLPKGVWWWRALVLGTLNIGAFFFLLFVAAYHLPGGVAALVGSVQPVVVLVLAAVLLGDRIRLPHVLACLAAAAGVALLVLRATARLDLVGVLAALGGAVCMAAGIVLTKRWQRPVNVLLFTGWQLTAGGLVLLPALLLAEGLPSTITGANALGFGYLVVLGSLFGYSVWFRGTDRVPAIGLSFLGFFSPIVATALGYLFLAQTLSPWQLLGAAVLIGAIVLVQLTPAKKPLPAPGRELQRTTS
ncbi:probable blue pigment (indigoidine) exporter [Lentzea xinjiangensis]|uniref:Probable blue pigment (Indigoidine) exporter n=1 Tax=Lentzea xinjiangensis TaxID=402600 RepID=A0A1H9RRU1_9PSEU|nr:EamA family transporter [Lentzea xinjiangensis]SER75377.1 probable blue pigment (indigoidine) exporter [Lentzea xinjiangensis]